MTEVRRHKSEAKMRNPESGIHNLRFRLPISEFRIQNSEFPRAFSLPEVMFAVMIMGIGFIMVAAMFPVAIQQSKDTRDETVAAEIAKTAVNVIQQQAATEALMPASAGLIDLALNQVFWRHPSQVGIQSSVIYGPDPRYAWTALYRRDANAPFAQIYVFVVNSANGQPFTTVDTSNGGSPNLWPRRVQIMGLAGGQIQVRADPGGYPGDARTAVAENTYILTADGSSYRVSSFTGTADTWQLYPGQDASAKYPGWTNAWLIGKHLNYNPSGTPPYTFDGTAQDISVYTTFVKVN